MTKLKPCKECKTIPNFYTTIGFNINSREMVIYEICCLCPLEKKLIKFTALVKDNNESLPFKSYIITDLIGNNCAESILNLFYRWNAENDRA